MTLRTRRGHAGLLSIYRGPLLFGLRMGEHWQQIGGELPHADWEVYPTTPWNYALALDPDNPAATLARGGAARRRRPLRPAGRRPVRITATGQPSAPPPPPRSPPRVAPPPPRRRGDLSPHHHTSARGGLPAVRVNRQSEVSTQR